MLPVHEEQHAVGAIAGTQALDLEVEQLGIVEKARLAKARTMAMSPSRATYCTASVARSRKASTMRSRISGAKRKGAATR